MQEPTSPSTPMKEKVAFFLHVRQLDTARIQHMLLQYPQWVNARDMPDEEPAQWYLPHMGRATPLLWAVNMAQPALCEMLLSYGADPNILSGSGMSALLTAVQGRHHEIAARLLDAGADPSVPLKRSGMTPLHVAASRGDAHLARMLLQHGADPDARDAQHRTPLDWAKLKGQEATFSHLISSSRRSK